MDKKMRESDCQDGEVPREEGRHADIDATPSVRVHRAIRDLERGTLMCLSDMRRFSERLAAGPLPWHPTISVEE